MIKLLELFGGIGACTKALKNIGCEFEVVDYVEIDKYAVKSYNAMNDTSFSPQDIRLWDKDIEVDLLLHGSPCQDFSKAGKQRGAEIGGDTRSSLMYESLRIIKKIKPKVVIWENVPNVLNKKHINNFFNYLTEMESMNYSNAYSILNPIDYGVPQSRKRLFVVSVLNYQEYVFPNKMKLEKTLFDYLDNNVEDKYYLSDKYIHYTFDLDNVFKKVNKTFNNRCFNTKIASAITCRGAVGQRIGITNIVSSKLSSDIKIEDYLKVNNGDIKLMKEDKLRVLTPLECFRLMGFDDDDFFKCKFVNSDSQLYKQAGNSIVVNVLVEIIIQLITFKILKGVIKDEYLY